MAFGDPGGLLRNFGDSGGAQYEQSDPSWVEKTSQSKKSDLSPALL